MRGAGRLNWSYWFDKGSLGAGMLGEALGETFETIAVRAIYPFVLADAVPTHHRLSLVAGNGWRLPALFHV